MSKSLIIDYLPFEIKEEQIRGRVICPYCSSRILFKSRGVAGSTVKAR